MREAHFGGTPASAKRLREATSDQLLQLGLESAGGTDDAVAPEAAVNAARSFLHKQPVAFEFVVPEVKQWEAMLQKANLGGRRRAITIAAGALGALVLLVLIRGRIEAYTRAAGTG